MGISDLFLDYQIETAPEGDKHNREGWVNVPCPHCTGHGGYHLGFNLDGGYFFCWRCGRHPIEDTLIELLGVGRGQAASIKKEYRIGRGNSKPDEKPVLKIGQKKFILPSDTNRFNRAHEKYLKKRFFDPDYLAKHWGLLGTSPTSSLDGIPYSYRILAPIYWNNKMVSFQTRDYTDRQDLKYLTCPMKREAIHHKHILYGKQDKWKDVGVLVEGIFDVWRVGDAGLSCFGIAYTPEQMHLLAQTFKGKRLFILFDPERQAQKQARLLSKQLAVRGVDAIQYKDLDTDPADMKQSDMNHLLKELKVYA